MSGGTDQRPPVEPAVPRHGRMPRHGAGATYAKIAASVIAVIAVSATAVVAYAAVDLVASVTAKPPVQLESEEVLENVPDIGAMEGGLNFLLVGSDKRPEDGAFGDPEEESAVLNDVTMLLHISQDHTHVEVVSFPRDLYVSVPECPDPNDPGGEPLSSLSSVKMNEVLSWGGFGCVASTIEQLTGVTIPVGGIVEFYGVAALSSAVGGVEVCVVERDRRRLHGPAPRPGNAFPLGHRRARLPPHPARGGRRQRPRPHLEPADVPRVADAHDAELGHARRPDQALLHRQGGALEHDPVERACRTPPSSWPSRGRCRTSTCRRSSSCSTRPRTPTTRAAWCRPIPSTVLNAALQADRPIAINPAATSESEFGTEADPNAQPAVPETPRDRGPVRDRRPRDSRRRRCPRT